MKIIMWVMSLLSLVGTASASNTTMSDGNMASMSPMQGMQMNSVFQSGAWSGVGIVFPGWVINSAFIYAATIIGIFLIAFLTQWLSAVMPHVDTYFIHKNSAAAIQLAKAAAGEEKFATTTASSAEPELTTIITMPTSTPASDLSPRLVGEVMSTPRLVGEVMLTPRLLVSSTLSFSGK